MCGIAGIVSTTRNTNDLVNRVEKMQKGLQHRGPDDQGLHSSNNAAAVLAHTRLSIIDLSANAHQPMSAQDERYTITFNGEIYNFKEIKQSLEKQGIAFKSNSDTEVILELYALEGKNCVTKLRGMFAFAIWDNKERSLFIARDPLGIKPVYLWQDGSSLGFSSEIRALLKSGLSNKQLCSQGLYSYFRHGSVSEPNTLVNDIQLLSAGHTLFWQNGRTQIEPYWQIDFDSRNSINDLNRTNGLNDLEQAHVHNNYRSHNSHKTNEEHVHQLISDSIRAHFVSDVPVGLFLSGGIDSTALLALANTQDLTPINTYSIAFEEPEWNEGDIAKRVAQEFGTNHTEHVMTAKTAKSIFPEYIKAIDQPSIDGFNSFCIAKVAHEHGEKVVLSGLGGDELFAGYKSFDLIPKMMRYGKFFGFTHPLLNQSKSPRFKRLADFLKMPHSAAAAHACVRGIFSTTEAIALVQQCGVSVDHIDQSTSEPNASNLSDKISELELSRYMRNQLLRDSDVMSMAWGLELRVPFVDQYLLEQLSTIPASQRLEYGKKLLVNSVTNIPEWVVNRPKQGFRFPFDKWFADEWQDFDFTTLKTQNINFEAWYRKWSVVVLNQWIEQHLS